jgi:hypothetical protein
MIRTLRGIAAALSVLFPMIINADALGDAERLLCASSRVARCDASDCELGLPQKWNIPSFVIVDLTKKTLSTTAASSAQRHSPIAYISRDQDSIFLQGSENGRTFSIVIDKATGHASIAIAADGFTVSVFGECTPMP